MTILCIETSTNCCSAAIAINGEAKAIRANLTGANHASELPLFVEELMNEARSNNWKIDAVALSQGPGSYTGLRIGASLAKGLCYGLNIPLIPVDTLQILCAAAVTQHLPQNALLCPMLDARRMEVYAAIYDRALNVKREIAADIIDENSYLEFLEKQPVYFFGNGAAKCREKITHPNAHFIDNIYPLAKWMFPLAEKAKSKEDFKDVAYFEPFYLKEFVASQPKKLI